MIPAFAPSVPVLFPIHAPRSNAHLCRFRPRACAASETRAWIRDVVVSLNLCPFALSPFENNAVRISVCDNVKDEEALTSVLSTEMGMLINASPSEIETTIVVLPSFSRHDFLRWHTYCTQLEDSLIDDDNVMVACFHPLHVWGEMDERDASHFERRAPHPIINLLRVATVDRAIESGSTQNMLERNKETLESVGYDEMVCRFAKLYGTF